MVEVLLKYKKEDKNIAENKKEVEYHQNTKIKRKINIKVVIPTVILIRILQIQLLFMMITNFKMHKQTNQKIKRIIKSKF